MRRRDARDMARKVAPVIAEGVQWIAATYGGIPDGVTMTEEELFAVLTRPFCDHGLPRIADCEDCAILYSLARQMRKIVEVGSGEAWDDDEAVAYARRLMAEAREG